MEDPKPEPWKQTLLCVGGPLAGTWHEGYVGTTFKAHHVEATASDFLREMDARRTVEPQAENPDDAPFPVKYCIYHEATFRDEQGDISIWVPINHTPRTTMQLLMGAYEQLAKTDARYVPRELETDR